MDGGSAAAGATGRCQCGAVRLRSGAPLTVYCCHCTECRRQAASAFGISVLVARDTLAVEGETAAWVRDAGEPTEVTCLSCPRCGVRVVHLREGSDRATLKGGILDDAAALAPVGHIWTASALPWVRPWLGGIVHEGQPPDYDALIAAWSARGDGPAQSEATA